MIVPDERTPKTFYQEQSPAKLVYISRLRRKEMPANAQKLGRSQKKICSGNVHTLHGRASHSHGRAAVGDYKGRGCDNGL